MQRLGDEVAFMVDMIDLDYLDQLCGYELEEEIWIPYYVPVFGVGSVLRDQVGALSLRTNVQKWAVSSIWFDRTENLLGLLAPLAADLGDEDDIDFRVFRSRALGLLGVEAALGDRRRFSLLNGSSQDSSEAGRTVLDLDELADMVFTRAEPIRRRETEASMRRLFDGRRIESRPGVELEADFSSERIKWQILVDDENLER